MNDIQTFKSLIIFDQYKVISKFLDKKKIKANEVVFNLEDELLIDGKQLFKLEDIINDLVLVSPKPIEMYSRSFQAVAEDSKKPNIKKAIELFKNKPLEYINNYWRYYVDNTYFGKKFTDASVFTSFINVSNVLEDQIYGRKLDFLYIRQYTLNEKIASSYVRLPKKHGNYLSVRVERFQDEINENEKLIVETLKDITPVKALLQANDLVKIKPSLKENNHNIAFMYYLACNNALVYRPKNQHKFHLLNGNQVYWFDLENKLDYDFKEEFIKLLNDYIDYEGAEYPEDCDEFDIGVNQLINYCIYIH